MRTQRLKRMVPQLQWLEDLIDEILNALTRIIGSLVPGRR